MPEDDAEIYRKMNNFDFQKLSVEVDADNKGKISRAFNTKSVMSGNTSLNSTPSNIRMRTQSIKMDLNRSIEEVTEQNANKNNDSKKSLRNSQTHDLSASNIV